LACGFALSRYQRGGQPERNVATSARAVSRAPSLLLAALLIVLGAGSSVLAVTALPADLALRRGQDKTLALDDRQAAGIQAVRYRPDELAYRLALAEIESRRQDYRSAAVQLEIADALAAGDPEVWRLQAELYARWLAVDPQQPGQAEQLYGRMVALAPTVARYQHSLGLALAHRGDLQAGVQALELAVALDATDVTAYRNLAIFYGALGRAGDADRAHRAAAYWADRLGD
jgi:tetratricopeptide (TPR) repeat protein